MKRHHVGASQFAELAASAGGPGAVRLLRDSQLSRRVVALGMIFQVARTDVVEPDRRRLLDRSMSVLVAAARRNRAATNDVLLDPMVGAWATTCLSRFHFPDDDPTPPHHPGPSPGRGTSPSSSPGPGSGSGSGQRDHLGYLGGVAAAAALRAGIVAELEMPTVDGRLVLPGLGHVDLSTAGPRPGDDGTWFSGWCRIRTHDGAAVVHGSDGTVVHIPPAGAVAGDQTRPDRTQAGDQRWRVPRRLACRSTSAGVLHLRVEEHDPHRGLGSAEVHPGLDDSEFCRWQHTFRQAWAVLADGHREQARALASIVNCIVPLTPDPTRPLHSATAEASFGAVRLALPPDATALAAILVHELQHAKLYALEHLVPLTVPGAPELFYVPWRDDPRPIGAVLQGAYAHLALINFWHRQRTLPDTDTDPDPARDRDRDTTFRFAWTREAVGRTLSSIGDRGRLTPAGARFVEAMRRSAERWNEITIDRDALSAVADSLAAHRHEWLSRIPGLA